MNTSLTERYIAATLRDLPPQMHDDVRPELAASIDDAVDEHVANGEQRDVAERAVLTELGDPAILAAEYTDRTLQLIGPRYYLMWWRLLKRLLIIIPPVVFAVVVFVQILASADLGTVIGEAIAITLSTALHVCFWVTLAFAIMERTGAETGVEWDVDQLPEPRDEEHGGTDLIASLVFLGLVLAAILWDQLQGFIQLNDTHVPILNPDLWPWAMVILLAIIALEVVFAIVLYIRRGWNTALAIVNTGLAVVFFSWVITLLVRGDLFSAAFLDLVATMLGDNTLYTLAVIFGFSVAIICIWDIIEGWTKTYRSTRSAGLQQ